jgi:hypothetical protein
MLYIHINHASRVQGVAYSPRPTYTFSVFVQSERVQTAIGLFISQNILREKYIEEQYL